MMGCALLLLLAQDVRVDAEAWYAGLRGRLDFDEKPLDGDPTDLRDDLGVGTALVPRVGLSLSWKPYRVSLAAEHIGFRSRETLDRPRRWNESALEAGDEVETRFSLLEAGLEGARVFSLGEGVELAAVIGARYLRFEVELVSDRTGRDDDHIGALASCLGTELVWRPSDRLRVDLEAELAVSAWGGDDILALAGAAHAGWKATGALGLSLGLRVEWMDVTKDIRVERNEVRLLVAGFTLALEIAF